MTESGINQEDFAHAMAFEGVLQDISEGRKPQFRKKVIADSSGEEYRRPRRMLKLRKLSMAMNYIFALNRGEHPPVPGILRPQGM